MKKEFDLSEKEKMIIYNCLKNMGENVSERYITFFDFKTGKLFRVFPNTLHKIGEKLK